MTHLLLPLLLLACAEPDDSDVLSDGDGLTADDTGSSDGGTTTTVDLDTWLVTLSDQVSEDRITETILALEGCQTRYTGTDGNAAARAWLTSAFEDLGYSVEEDPFTFGSTESENLIARLPGTSSTAPAWILSAHYDSTSDQRETLAPGADDNASAVAAVLEAARLLRDQPHKADIWFVLTGAEEQGSRGSAHLAEALASEGQSVGGVIAPDMIGYWPLGAGDAFDIVGDDQSAALVASMSDTADLLGVANKPFIQHSYCEGDDHTNYQDAGFPAVAPMDCAEAHNLPSSGETTPHYHMTTDTLDTLDLGFTRDVAGVLVATLSLWAEPEL